MLEGRFSVTFEQIDRAQAPVKRRRKIMVDLLTSMTYLTFCIFLMAYFVRTTREFLVPHVPQLIASIPIVDYFADALSSPLISDLQTIPTNESCPENYTRIPVGFWPGTSQGCFCPQTHAFISATTCDSPCQEVPITPRIPLYVWKETYFCAKYNSKYILSPARVCLSSYKLCGVYMCIPESEDCPITEIRISTGNIHGYESRKLANGELVLFKRNASSTSHLRALTAHLNGRPCLNPIRSQERNGTRPYLLLDLLEIGCDKYNIDNDTAIVDHNDELGFYSQNQLFEDVINRLPNFEEYAENQKMVLSAIFRPKLATLTSRPQKIGPCLTIDPHIIRSYNENIHAFAEGLDTYISAFFPLAGALITIGNFYAIYIMMKITCYLSGSQGFFSKIEMILKWTTVFSTLGILVFYLTRARYLEHSAEKLIKLQDYFLEVSHKDCFFDHDLNLMLMDASELIMKTLRNNLKNAKDVRKVVLVLTPFVLLGFVVGTVLGFQIAKPQLLDDEDQEKDAEDARHDTRHGEPDSAVLMKPLAHSLTEFSRKPIDL